MILLRVFGNAILMWLLLNMLALALIRMRFDAKTIQKDLHTMINVKYPMRLMSYFFLFFILPFTIPYHLIHLAKHWNDSE